MHNYQCGEDIHMFAGTSSDFCFHLAFQNGHPLSATGVTAAFSLSHYSDLYMEPLITKEGTLNINEADNTITSVLVGLLPGETVDFQTGKYVYNLKITDRDGGIDVPSHGFLFIRRI